MQGKERNEVRKDRIRSGRTKKSQEGHNKIRKDIIRSGRTE